MFDHQLNRRLYRLGTLTLVVGCLGNLAAPAFTAEVQFARDIRPLLSDRCFACHGPDRNGQENDLRLDERDAATADAIVIGDADSSELMRRITSDDPDTMMPPPDANRKVLSREEIDRFRQWINSGAEYTEHWSYRRPRRVEPPVVTKKEWQGNPIDAFIAHRNEARAIEQSMPANRRTLARRLSFDLLGLPPSPSDVHEFEDDVSPDAYERLVDRFLKSQHFGERLAVLWLDLVRYADTVGYHGDQHREIDAYRDYVIDAFNANMPFDRFTIEQLAGDLLARPTPHQLVASGFNRLLQTTQEGGAQPAEYRAIYDADRVRNVSTVWLGATLGCAQCHDHKFDPFTTTEFYRFAAFFADVEETAVGVQQPNLQLPTAEQQQALRSLELQIEELKRTPASCSSNQNDETTSAADEAAAEVSPEQSEEQRKARLKKLEQQREQLKKRIRTTLVTRSVQPRTMRVLPRGNWLDQSGEEVSPGVPGVFGQLEFEGKRGTRMDLARWLVSDENPLTARVFVNHLWRMMFGYGLVRTPDDFGSQGEFPTHPELLDFLAVEFQRSDWNIKYIVRMIALSRTYQQASEPRYTQRDPFNVWYSSQNRFRLDAEMIRDNALSVSGLLVSDVGGRSVKPYQPAGYWRELNFPKRKYTPDNGASQYRRGLYTYWCRTFLHPSLAAFDAPSREECTAQRPRSNTPLQALVLLNDPTYVEAAVALAKRILGESNADETHAKTVERFYSVVLSREPTMPELKLVVQLFEQQEAHYRHDLEAAAKLLAVDRSGRVVESEDATLAAWSAVARVLLNLHETVTRR